VWNIQDWGAIRDAETVLRRSLELDRNSATAHYCLGVVLFRTGDVQGAELSARRAVQQSAESAWAHFFRYNASAKSKAKKVAVKHKPATKRARLTPAPTAVAAKPNPQVTGLQKRLAAAKKKLDFAKAAGKPTQLFEDRIYEIEDELRMVGNAQ
jgi:hypothetical protein